MIDARQAQWQREKIEWVFGLLKDELGVTPWGDWAWWYDGPPKHVYNQFPEDRYYRTVIINGAVDAPPDDIEGWKLINVYPSTGNTECPGGWMGDGTVNRASAVEVNKGHWLCPYCESAKGTAHGIIHIGSGYVEAVYSKPEEP